MLISKPAAQKILLALWTATALTAFVGAELDMSALVLPSIGLGALSLGWIWLNTSKA
jgi:hypothetical protein